MKINNKEKLETIALYCKDLKLTPVYTSLLGIFKYAKSSDVIIVSHSRIIRKAASLLGIRFDDPYLLYHEAERYLAFKDAVTLLAKKGVSVFFFNRIGKEKDFKYSESAKARMASGLSFPEMYKSLEKYETELKELFGEKYNLQYVKKVGNISQVIHKGDIYCHEDCKGEYVNVINGKRITIYQPTEYKRTIHMYGRCGVFGYAVEDKDTLPSLLQKILRDNGYNDLRVMNHGLWGGDNDILDRNFCSDVANIGQDDVVIFYRKHWDYNLLDNLALVGVKYFDITHKWHEYDEAKWCFYDRPGHMNSIGYQHVAQIIGDELIKCGFKSNLVSQSIIDCFTAKHLNSFLKSNDLSDFHKEIKNYTETILADYPLQNKAMVCGSIVMNCNPFTKGHRYLIEYAAKRVDRLYIFVVQEDKSFFKYEDRFEMVKRGTANIENVVVVSSGKFIISSLTFPEYFMKDYVKEKNFDVSMDVETFCKYIAPPLNIKKRFAGEEPFDPVTKNYNENMSRILPEYGMEFCEIPRLALDKEHVINATEVRRLLKERDFESIDKYVPESTLEILKEKY